MTIGTWNVRTLLDVNNYRPERRTALITQELARLDIDIAALSETRLSGEGHISEVRSGYTIFWKGMDAGEPRIHGAGFSVKTKIVKDLRLTPVSINERLMTLRVPIGSDRVITFVSAYAPTLDSDEDTKNQFYHQLNSTLSKIPIQDKLILLGDFNARVGRDNRFWRDVMGKQGVGNCYANGLLLLGLCVEHELFISNTQFRFPNRYKTTLMHPRSKHWHLIDYVITRQRDKKDILITKAALNIDECWTDHRLLISRLRVPKYRKPRSHFSDLPRRKFNISNLNNKNVRSHFQDILSEQLNKAPTTTDDVEREWTTLKNIIKETAENVVGFSARKRSDWFDDNHGEIQAIINAKRDAYLFLAQDPSCAEKKAHFQELKQKCQSEIQVIKNKWWQQKATELHNLSDARNLRGFYAFIKELYGPIRSSSGTLKAADNSTILTERKKMTEQDKSSIAGKAKGDTEQVIKMDRINRDLDSAEMFSSDLHSMRILLAGDSQVETEQTNELPLNLSDSISEGVEEEISKDIKQGNEQASSSVALEVSNLPEEVKSDIPEQFALQLEQQVDIKLRQVVDKVGTELDQVKKACAKEHKEGVSMESGNILMFAIAEPLEGGVSSEERVSGIVSEFMFDGDKQHGQPLGLSGGEVELLESRAEWAEAERMCKLSLHDRLLEGSSGWQVGRYYKRKTQKAKWMQEELCKAIKSGRKIREV
ncbi:uncharacterized protein LOC124722607 [Schistocerca piceifrons]|uniref:uncharacterized protein LOC124722607 n=1 Tax=Schistocerca piceifrons TaxID=274613 RepID=UPI001F5FE185|nr:uncharacterized protein LOC124722607 [Schistocerca piceifrons]